VRGKGTKGKGKEAESCDWTGKLNEAERHFDECPFAKVACPNIGCNESFPRKHLPAHVKNCFFLLVSCQWCKKRKSVDLLDDHLLRCRECPVFCPNDCLDGNGKVSYFTRCKISDHLILCAMELVECK
jgi:hypothetical protein